MRFCLHLIGVLMSKMKAHLYDAMWQMERGFGYQADDTPADHREYRYEERGDTYTLRCWCKGVETSIAGAKSERSEWLVRIIDMAKIGGHMSIVKQPPPDCIVWFETDANQNLESFKEMSKQ